MVTAIGDEYWLGCACMAEHGNHGLLPREQCCAHARGPGDILGQDGGAQASAHGAPSQAGYADWPTEALKAMPYTAASLAAHMEIRRLQVSFHCLPHFNGWGKSRVCKGRAPDRTSCTLATCSHATLIDLAFATLSHFPLSGRLTRELFEAYHWHPWQKPR